jgi:hypothetical protein
MSILDPLAIIPKQTKLFSNFGILGGQSACISEGTEILPRVKAKTTNITETADSLTVDFSTMSLSGIFDDIQIMLSGDL